MKIKLVQDSIVFISAIKLEELMEAKRFVPEACTLTVRDEESKKAKPVCAIAYADEGSVCDNGIVFDSTTDDGFMCKTLLASQGTDEHLTAEERVKLVSENFAGLILKMNELEEQIKAAIEDNAAKIAAAKQSVEVVNI
jgi:hypothetical protein